MKTTSLLALAALMYGAEATTPAVQEEEISDLTPEEQVRENTMWYIDGVKGFYDGFYRSFYKRHMSEEQMQCLDDSTIENIVTFRSILKNPFTIFKPAEIKNDFNLLAEGTEVLGNVAQCNFEGPWFDILTFCK